MTGEVLDINGGAHLMRYPDLNKHVLAAFSERQKTAPGLRMPCGSRACLTRWLSARASGPR